MDVLTLTLLEQAATLRALVAQRDSLPDGHGERLLLDALIVKVGAQAPSVTLAHIETFAMLRRLRMARQRVGDELRALEERRRLGVDGRLDIEWREFDGEAACLDAVLRKLWQLMP